MLHEYDGLLLLLLHVSVQWLLVLHEHDRLLRALEIEHFIYKSSQSHHLLIARMLRLLLLKQLYRHCRVLLLLRSLEITFIHVRESQVQ